MNNRKGAIEGENIACELLASRGFKILERNFRTRAGEIDIVARDGRTYVFVEVKRREDDAFGHPAEFVNASKMYKLAGAAQSWLTAHGVKGKPCRFDVVTILGDEAELIEGAFDLQDAARGAYPVRNRRG